MRIISGYAKGRKLKSPPSKGGEIRPTSDRAREALFSIIASHIPGALVLDLFAGTGALGLEALSRGAKAACFVDFYPQALTLIRQNIRICMDLFTHQHNGHEQHLADGSGSLDSPQAATLIRHDLNRGLPYFPEKSLLTSGFDLIFLDPPYSQGLSHKTLQALDTSSLLHQHSLIIAEERAKETLPQQLTTLNLIDQRTYGEAGFWLYQPLAKALSH